MTAATPLTVCVDFDGTICHYAFPGCGEPRREVIDVLRALRAEGWQIIVHTARVNSHWREPGRSDRCQEMLVYLLDHDVPFGSIWGIVMWPYRQPYLGFRIGSVEIHRVHPTQKHEGCAWAFQPEVTGKPVAHAYIDDRAVAAALGLSYPGLLALCHDVAQRANDQHRER